MLINYNEGTMISSIIIELQMGTKYQDLNHTNFIFNLHDIEPLLHSNTLNHHTPNF